MCKIKGKKGRPIGFRLSAASKRAISESKRGQKHKEATKSKISRSLKSYFRRKNPLSEELVNRYCRMNDDGTCGWIREVSEELDSCMDILTQRALFNKLRVEISYGNNIEDVFSHSITPEVLLICKEFLENRGKEENGKARTSQEA